jgi:aspartyl protease family protein
MRYRTRLMSNLCVCLCATAALMFALEVSAATVNVVGLFGSKAVVTVDGGAPHSIGVGETAGGFKLVSVDANGATFMVDGRRQTIAMGSYLAKTSSNDRSKAVLTADTRGHYVTQGTINGASTRFLVDTGATLVVLSSNEADRLGIQYKQAQRGNANTANGSVGYRLVKLDRVKVGDVELNNVDAGVLEGGYDGPNLLGMSFLSRTEVSRDGQSMVLTRRF